MSEADEELRITDLVGKNAYVFSLSATPLFVSTVMTYGRFPICSSTVFKKKKIDSNYTSANFHLMEASMTLATRLSVSSSLQSQSGIMMG